MGKHKIVVIAGGGTFGYIPVRFLKEAGFDISRIDAIAGTSIGGITAAYLAQQKNKSIDQLFNDFKVEVVKIFASPGILRNLDPCCSKFPASNVEDSLQRMLEGNFGDVKVPVIAASRDYAVDDHPVMFASFDPEHAKLPLWQIGRCTSAAPTYFPAFGMVDPVTLEEMVMLDGGIINNLPVITVALMLEEQFGWKFEDMDIFALGTGWLQTKRRTLKSVNRYGNIMWLKNLILPNVTMSNEIIADYQARRMGFASYTYYNPVMISGDMADASLVTKGTLDKGIEPCIEDFKKHWGMFMGDIPSTEKNRCVKPMAIVERENRRLQLKRKLQCRKS